MQLGAFSISLSVKDLEVSRAFYAKLGFEATGGGDKWLIMKNGLTIIGLFEGMFEKNILTFNPGFAQDTRPETGFTDVRELEAKLRSMGLEVEQSTTAASETGPASFVVVDPDGNPILVDQHV